MNEKDRFRLETRARILKALAHPTRLWMVEQLLNGERCVCEFAAAVDADFSTVSRHLSVLKSAGIVADDKRGKQVYYRLLVPCILNFMDCVETVIQERSRYLKSVLEKS